MDVGRGEVSEGSVAAKDSRRVRFDAVRLFSRQLGIPVVMKSTRNKYTSCTYL